VPKDTFCGGYKFCGSDVLINVNNGVLKIGGDGSIGILSHSPDYCFTAHLAANYDPDAKRDIFDMALNKMLPEGEDRFLYQVFAGYILFPSCKLQVALVCFGPGGTGKSTIANSLAHVLGPDLCSSIGLEELSKSGSYATPTLKSKMLNLGAELKSDELVESAFFKTLASGESLNVRQIYRAPEEMRTTCKLLFLSNTMPRFRGGTDAELRRMRMLHFNQKPTVTDPQLPQKLEDESSGILNWMLEGLAWLIQHNHMPKGGTRSKDLLDAFERGNDPIGTFLRESCEFASTYSCTKSTLWDRYTQWCEKYGQTTEKMENYFFKTLLQRHPELKSSRITGNDGARQYAYRGIRLI